MRRLVRCTNLWLSCDMVISQNVYFYSNWIEVNSQEILFNINAHFLTQLRLWLLWISHVVCFKVSMIQFYLSTDWRMKKAHLRQWKFKSGTGFSLGINIFNQSLENLNEKLTLKNVGFRTMDIRSQSFIWSVSGNVFVIVKDEILFNIFVTIQILFEECRRHSVILEMYKVSISWLILTLNDLCTIYVLMTNDLSEKYFC